MRVLFDQGTPAPLRHALAPHEVSTAFELGWSNLENGDLLREADGLTGELRAASVSLLMIEKLLQ